MFVIFFFILSRFVVQDNINVGMMAQNEVLNLLRFVAQDNVNVRMIMT